MPDPRQTVGAAIGLMVLLLLGTVLLGMVAGVAPTFIGGGDTGNQTDDVPILGGSGQLQVSQGVTVEEVHTARTSLNDSLALTGAPDSNVTIEGSWDLGHDFSACTYAAADAGVVSGNETRMLFATEEAILWYNGTDDVWRGYYYNTSSRNSYRAEVTATSPSTPTLVCLNHGETTLNLTANTTIGTNITTGGANTAAYPANLSNWHGEVEETRLYGGGPLNHSQRAEWTGDPVLALQGATPSARVTYDTRESSVPSSFTAYFGDGSATPSNASLATGRGGPAIAEGTDYSVSGDTISVLGGGSLDDNGEVLYVEYATNTTGWAQTLSAMGADFRQTITFANLIPFLLVAFLVIAMLRL